MSQVRRKRYSLFEKSKTSERTQLFSMSDVKRKIKIIFQRNYRLILTFLLVLSDEISNLSMMVILYIVTNVLNIEIDMALYKYLLPSLLLIPVAFALSGLYPAIGMHSIEAFRRLYIATFTFYLMIYLFLYFIFHMDGSILIALVFCLSGALALIPFGRSILRKILISLSAYGESVAIIGTGEQTKKIVDFLALEPRLGYRPILVNENNHDGEINLPSSDSSTPITYILQNLPKITDLKTAFVVLGEISPEFLQSLVLFNEVRFKRLIIIPQDWPWGLTAVSSNGIDGLFGLEVKHNFQKKAYLLLKRIMDLGIIILTSPFWLLLIGLCAIAVKIDSPGPVFYAHTRLGHKGKKFKVWKLRSMTNDADQQLSGYLANDPQALADWKEKYKITRDKRITRVGKILRRFSLDELPQFWNVLRGEMSLVGPRPIVDDEKTRFGKKLDVILLVKPGISGYWQISDRNNLLYNERVLMDEYYVYHCSFWFDLYVILKTVIAMLGGKGAY